MLGLDPTIPESYPCGLCGDPVPQCRIKACDGCREGEHDSGICVCCAEVICPKHTAAVTCPHAPSDHDEPADAPSAEE